MIWRARIVEISPGRLLIAPPRVLRLLAVVVAFGFYGVWLFSFFGLFSSDPDDVLSAFLRQMEVNPYLWFFVLPPLLFCLYALYELILGEEVIFDALAQSITRNRRKIGHFSEVTGVEIKSVRRGNSTTLHHRLVLVFNDDRQRTILKDVDYDDIGEARRRIERMLNRNDRP